MASTKTNSTKNAERYFTDQLNFTINPDGLKEIVDLRSSIHVIVDVRRIEYFKKGHIPLAINIPFDQYNYFAGEERCFPSLTKEGINYVYCYSSLCLLAKMACKKFASLGYPVKEILGGFTAWENYGYEIEKI